MASNPTVPGPFLGIDVPPPPIRVTEAAADQARAFLAREPGHTGVRLSVEPGDGCCRTEAHRVELAEGAKEGEVVIAHGDVKVFVSRADAQALRGAVLDWVEAREGEAGFKVRSAGRQHQCGGGHACT